TEPDGQRMHDLHLPDARLKLFGSCTFIALEAELHILGRGGITVVELEPAAQLELVREAVRALAPRLGQTRAHLLVRLRAYERVVHPVRRADGRGSGRFAGR